MGFLSLIAKLSLNTSNFELGLKRSESAVSKFSRTIDGNVKAGLAAAFGGAAILAATKNAMDYAGKIEDLSIGLGVSARSLQEFDFAAKQSGGTLDDMVSVMEKLAASRQKAINDPTSKLAADFNALGVSIDDLKNKRLDDLVRQIGSAFKNAEDPQRLLERGFSTMGKSSLPVITAMRGGLDESAESAQKLGVIISDEATSSLARLGDELDILKDRTRSFFGEAAPMIAKWISTGVDAIRWAVGGAATFYGALSSGATMDQAGKMAKEYGDSLIQAGIERDAEMARSKAKRAEVASKALNLIPDESEKKGGESSKMTQSMVTSRQQIGAFIAAPAVSEQKRTNQILKQIEKNTKEMKGGGVYCDNIFPESVR